MCTQKPNVCTQYIKEVFMEKLNVRFSDVQKIRIDDVSISMDIDFSKVARAAMKLGIQQLITLGSVCPEKARNLILITDEKAK